MVFAFVGVCVILFPIFLCFSAFQTFGGYVKGASAVDACWRLLLFFFALPAIFSCFSAFQKPWGLWYAKGASALYSSWRLHCFFGGVLSSYVLQPFRNQGILTELPLFMCASAFPLSTCFAVCIIYCAFCLLLSYVSQLFKSQVGIIRDLPLSTFAGICVVLLFFAAACYWFMFFSFSKAMGGMMRGTFRSLRFFVALLCFLLVIC